MKRGGSKGIKHYVWANQITNLLKIFDHSEKHERTKYPEEIKMRLLFLILILSNIIFCQEKNLIHENVTLQMVDDFLKHCNSFPEEGSHEKIVILSFLEQKNEITLSMIYTIYYKKDLFKAFFQYKGVNCIVYSYPDSLYKKFTPISLSITTYQKDKLAFEFENNFGIYEGIERTYKISETKKYKKISEKFLIPPNYWHD